MDLEKTDKQFHAKVKKYTESMDKERARFFEDFSICILGSKIINELRKDDVSYEDQKWDFIERLTVAWEYAEKIGISNAIILDISQAAVEVASVIVEEEVAKAKEVVRKAGSRLGLLITKQSQARGSN